MVSAPRGKAMPPRGLHGVDVKQRAMGPAQGGYLVDRVQHAGLIVGGHAADQGGACLAKCPFQRVQIERAVGMHGQDGGAGRGRADGVVLGRADQDAAAWGECGDGQRVGFGAA